MCALRAHISKILTNNLLSKVRYFLEEMKGDIVELKMFPKYF